MDGSRDGRRPLSRGEWLAIALAVVAVAALGALWLRSRAPPAREAGGTSAPAGEPGAPPDATAPGSAPGAAPREVAPAEVRAALEPVSADPLFRRALAADEPLRRWAVLLDNLAEGVSPRRALGFLAPPGPFSVVEREGALVVAPESFARYDAFAAAVSSVDAAALASAYRALHPALESAYRLLGYPDASLDRVAARALQRLAAAPVPEGELEVAPAEQGAGYVLADERLEALGPVEKHLLRMGPRNALRVQAKARELAQALGFPAQGAPRPE